MEDFFSCGISVHLELDTTSNFFPSKLWTLSWSQGRFMTFGSLSPWSSWNRYCSKVMLSQGLLLWLRSRVGEFGIKPHLGLRLGLLSEDPWAVCLCFFLGMMRMVFAQATVLRVYSWPCPEGSFLMWLRGTCSAGNQTGSYRAAGALLQYHLLDPVVCFSPHSLSCGLNAVREGSRFQFPRCLSATEFFIVSLLVILLLFFFWPTFFLQSSALA